MEKRRQIPACAGMTYGEVGMTYRGIAITEV